jgi:hypothetical protein
MIKIIWEARETKKAINLPIMINPAMGKQSAWYLAFSMVSWGKPTLAFIKSVKNLKDDAIEAILDEAKEAAWASHYRDEGNDDVDSDNECANLVNGSDSTLSDEYFSNDVWCKLSIHITKF